MFRLKGYTSRTLRKQYPHLMKLPSMWTRSYYCESTSSEVSSDARAGRGTAGEMSATTIKNI